MQKIITNPRKNQTVVHKIDTSTTKDREHGQQIRKGISALYSCMYGPEAEELICPSRQPNETQVKTLASDDSYEKQIKIEKKYNELLELIKV